MADFEASINRWVTATQRKINGIVPAIGLEALARLKELTPVDTGNLRASWHMSIKSPSHVQLSTNVVYARRVEYGFVGEDKLGRKYNQKGRGMVQQTVKELPRIARRVAQRLSGQ